MSRKHQVIFFAPVCVSQVHACMQACVIMAGKVKGTKR